MQLKTHSGIHLTYCSNIHPGETWSEVREQLENHLPGLKSRISPEKPLGVGLRLSSEAAEDLLEGDALSRFKDWLKREELYVFTMNGFPYGDFHHRRVKDLVYAPDWRTGERVRYTRILIQILAKLLPDGMDGGISTSPVSYKRWLRQPSLREEAYRSGSKNLAWIAFELARLEKEEGKEIHIDIEPEPDCLLENSRETVDFFTNWLFKTGAAFLTDEFDIGPGAARAIIRDHIRVCYDTCHFAVEYENPRQSIEAFKEAGVRVGKIQISSALKVQLDQPEMNRQKIGKRLSTFDEPTYLHQVIERRGENGFHHYRDLPEALLRIHNKEASEWRIHFHVPIFLDRFDFMHSTQNEIIESLEVILNETGCRHFEIETYTWEVLPDDLKVDITSSIEREFRWILGVMNEQG